MSRQLPPPCLAIDGTSPVFRAPCSHTPRAPSPPALWWVPSHPSHSLPSPPTFPHSSPDPITPGNPIRAVFLRTRFFPLASACKNPHAGTRITPYSTAHPPCLQIIPRHLRNVPAKISDRRPAEKRLLCLARAVVRSALPPTLIIHISSPMQVRISPSYWQAPHKPPSESRRLPRINSGADSHLTPALSNSRSTMSLANH